VWIKGSADHTAELIRRFDRAPKPMYYQPEFLVPVWQAYLRDTGLTEGEVDPDTFVRHAYAQALAHRQPRYEMMAQNWGITVHADDIARVTSAGDVIDLIAHTLEAGQKPV
jgi:hypothetical protein